MWGPRSVRTLALGETVVKRRKREVSSNESIVAEVRRPQTLQADKGKEFYNATMVEERRYPSFFHVGRRQGIDRGTV